MSTPPKTLVQGDSDDWEVSDSDLTVGGDWTAKTVFVEDLAADAQLTLNGVITAGKATFTLGAIQSATLNPGVTNWFVVLENTVTDERKTVCSGTTRVHYDPLATSKTQSFARKMLGLIETRLQGQAVDGEQSVTLEGVTVTYHDMTELEALRSKYAREVRMEERIDAGQHPSGITFGRVRFG